MTRTNLHRSHIVLVLLLAVILIGGAMLVLRSGRLVSPVAEIETSTGEAEPQLLGVSRFEIEGARRRLASELEREPTETEVFAALGHSYFEKKDFERALLCLERVPGNDREHGPGARLRQGFAAYHTHRALLAEACFREYLSLEQPDRPEAREEQRQVLKHLVYLLGVELRFRERAELLEQFVQSGDADEYSLLQYCFPTLLRWNGPRAHTALNEFLEQDPLAGALLAAKVVYLVAYGEVAEAETIIAQLRRDDPSRPAFVTAELYLLKEAARWDEMTLLCAALPVPSESDPWLMNRLRGHWNLNRRNFEAARDCFEVVLQQDPASADAALGMARSLAGLGDDEQQQVWLRRAAAMSRIQNRLGSAVTRTASNEPLLPIIELCLEADLLRPARLLAEFVLERQPDLRAAQTLLQEIVAQEEATP